MFLQYFSLCACEGMAQYFFGGESDSGFSMFFRFLSGAWPNIVSGENPTNGVHSFVGCVTWGMAQFFLFLFLFFCWRMPLTLFIFFWLCYLGHGPTFVLGESHECFYNIFR